MKKLLVASILVSGVSFAADKAADKFKSLDKDGDGQVSTEEAASDSELTSHFATLDKNADGKLSADELKAAEHGKKVHEAKKAK